jgi:hypothetical protein
MLDLVERYISLYGIEAMAYDLLIATGGDLRQK